MLNGVLGISEKGHHDGKNQCTAGDEEGRKVSTDDVLAKTPCKGRHAKTQCRKQPRAK